MPKKIAMIIAHKGFRDEEYWIPKEAFAKAGIDVVTVSSSISPATSKFGKTATVDTAIDNVQASEYDALLFVGGPGTGEYFHLPKARQLAKDICDQSKLLTAICIAPVILAKSGLLAGKQATVFPSGADELVKGGATYTGESVTIDGNLITACGPEAAQEFADKIIEKMVAELKS